MTRSLLRLALAFVGLALLASAPALTAQIPAPVGPSPLAEYPGFGHHPEADEARFETESMARQRHIVRCMALAGFEYHPTLPFVTPPEDAGARAALDLLRDRPNERYVASLADAERERYHLALYGVPDPDDPRAEALHDPSSSTGGGCLAAAHREIPGVFAAKAELTEELLEMERVVRRDRRVEAAEARWAECMAEEGYETPSPQALNARLDQAVAEALRQGTDVPREIYEEQARAVDSARLCGERVGLERTIARVRHEREAAFVEAHRELLERHAERQRRQDLTLDLTP